MNSFTVLGLITLVAVAAFTYRALLLRRQFRLERLNVSALCPIFMPVLKSGVLVNFFYSSSGAPHISLFSTMMPRIKFLSTCSESCVLSPLFCSKRPSRLSPAAEPLSCPIGWHEI